METKRNMGIRIPMAVIGIGLAGVCVGLQKISGLGVDPFSVLVFGLGNVFHVTYHTAFVGICVILAVIALALNKKILGVATIMSLFFSGYVTDATTAVVTGIVGQHPSMTVRVSLLIVVILLISVSAALYYSSELGVSPYDAQALTIAEKTKLPFRAVRISTDVVCCGIGFFMGGDLGLATVLCAFCMGPCIQFCREHITDKMAAGELFETRQQRKGAHRGIKMQLSR